MSLDPNAVVMEYLGWHGPATFFRQPVLGVKDAANIDLGLIGVPFAGGNPLARTSFLAPRALRDISMGLCRTHRKFMFNPFKVCHSADLGDAPMPNLLDNAKTVADIQNYFAEVHAAGIIPFSFGGDHTIPAPILRAIAGPGSGRKGPVGMVHVDAHTDTLGAALGANDHCGGFLFNLVNEGIVDPKRVIQVGLNGHIGSPELEDWAKSVGIRMMTNEEFDDIGLAAAVAEIRRVVGDGETYFTFDIDSLDPIYVSCTGVPELGGFTPKEAVGIIRGCRGLNLIGGDIVCFHPLLGDTRMTSFYTAAIAYEIITILAEVIPRRK